MTALQHSWFMTQRRLRNLARQPFSIALSMAQPLIWLLLFGELFKRTVQIPGFGVGSYISYLTPGVVVMSALFSAGWSGIFVVDDLERGVLDRFLTSPVRRVSLIAGGQIELAVVVAIQAAIILTVGFLRGARFEGGVVGIVVLLLSAMLLSTLFGALSNALALAVRQREAVIGGAQFVLLPVSFLSSVFLPSSLMPSWLATVARANPVNWAVQAARSALGPAPDWDSILISLGALLALAVVAVWIATRSFRSYLHSV